MPEINHKYKISVIIPSRNRASQIEFCIETLTNQNLPKDDFEVLVIDDGSTDDTINRLLPYKKIINLNIISTHRKDPAFRAALARNIGAKHAKGEILLFIDSDIVSDPNLLKEHVKSYIKDKNISVVGYRFQLKRDFHHILRYLIRQKKFDAVPYLPLRVDVREPGYRYYKIKDLSEFPAPWRYYHSNNISMTKEAFNKVGGFDESFTGWGDEDLELGYRLWKDGNKIILNRNAVGIHLDHSLDSKSRLNAIIENKNRFLSKHKDVHVELYNDFLSAAETITPEISSLEEIQNSFNSNYKKRKTEQISLKSNAKTLLIGAGGEINFKAKISAVVDLRKNCLKQYKGKTLRLRSGLRERLNLVGYNLPFRENSFDLTVISHYLGLFSDYTIFRIIAQAIRLSKKVLIYEDKKMTEKITEIVNSFESREIKIMPQIKGQLKYIEIQKKKPSNDYKNTIGLLLLPMLSDYLNVVNNYFGELAFKKREDIQWRERLMDAIDKYFNLCLFINPNYFYEVWAKDAFNFRKIAGKVWQSFRREEIIPEEDGIHIYPGIQSTYWRPGKNIKWFTDKEKVYKLTEEVKEKYNFFVDANIYSNKEQKLLSEKYGINKKDSIILTENSEGLYFLLFLEGYESESENYKSEKKKLIKVLNLLKEKYPGIEPKCHIYCVWQEDLFQKRLPELGIKKGIWADYMKSFTLAYKANRDQQIEKIQEIKEDIVKLGFKDNLSFYLIDIKEIDNLPKENYITLRLLNKKKMLNIVDSFSYGTKEKEKKDKKLVDFIKNLQTKPETLNIRNCCFFIMAENFEKAIFYLKRIKNKIYSKIFKAILMAEAENYKEALNIFKEVENKLQSIPDFIVSFLYAKVGVIYFESKKSKLAFKYWRKSRLLDRENYLANMSLFWAKHFK